MVKVLTARADCACISDTTSDESTPPDRKAPSGTSAAICLATASRNNVSSACTASAGEPTNGFASPAAIIWRASQ